MGLIHVDTAGFGALHLTEAARPVFRHEQAITLRKDQPKRAADMRRALSRPADLPEHAAPLFDALRAERSRLAKKQGVPPYVIFHDSTLRAMAMAKPRDLEEMVDLPGIGAAKLSRYGKAFLEIIRAAV